MEHVRRQWRKAPHQIRKIIVLVVGTLCLIAGVLMLAIPGPGWATIFLGLAILASEFSSAARLKRVLVGRLKIIAEKAKSRKR